MELIAGVRNSLQRTAGRGRYRALSGLQGRETINGLYKAEVIHRRGPWKTKQAVELATLEWVSWFNHHRLMGPLGNVPPAEFEANYHQQRTGQAATA